MSEIINETEQWKLCGDCNKCRRANHCTKSCTAKKKREQRKVEAIKDAMFHAVAPGLERYY